MFKSRVIIAALAAAVLSIFAAPAANAAYAPPPFSADVPGNVGPGEEFSITFDSGNVNCAWSLVPFHGQTAPGGSGTSYTVTLTAPDSDGTYTVTANCTWDPETVNNASADVSDPSAVTPAVYTASAKTDSLLAVPQTDSYSVEIVVGDGGDDGDDDGDGGSDNGGGLPNTGGSNVTLLALGAGLVVAGAGVTFAARRRKTA